MKWTGHRFLSFGFKVSTYPTMRWTRHRFLSFGFMVSTCLAMRFGPGTGFGPLVFDSLLVIVYK